MKIKYKKIILVFIVTIAIFGVYLVYAGFTYSTKQDMGSISTIIDVANPSFTGSIAIQANDSPPTCNAGAEGVIYADNSENRLKICNGSKYVWLEY